MKTLRMIFDLIEEGKLSEILGKNEMMQRFKDMMKFGLIEVGEQQVIITPRGQELRSSQNDSGRPDLLFPEKTFLQHREEFQVLRLSSLLVFLCWAAGLVFFLYYLVLCCS